MTPRAAWLTTNDVTTGRAPGYPDLQDRVYAAPAARVFAEADAACRSLARWIVAEQDPVAGRLEVNVRTALGGFTDDVTVVVVPAGPNAARVSVRSRSRVGRADLGENARHIRALQKVMDARLPRAEE